MALSMINPVAWFAGVPPEIAVFFLSMIPLTEFQVSIPLGIETFDLPVWEVWLLALSGNMVPVFILLWLLPKMYHWILTLPVIGPFLLKKVEKDRIEFAKKFEKYGAIALVSFIALPFPLTGAWTASLVAFIFNIPYKKAAYFIFLGGIVAVSIVVLLTLFAGETIRFLFAR